MLPDMEGFEACRRLRQARVWTPVLMLTARTAVRDRIRGLDAGADDYLAKPFALDELLARIRALGRRGKVERPTALTLGDLRLDPATRRVFRGDHEIELSRQELALLEVFLRRPEQVLTRDQLLEHAWDIAFESRSNVVDVYVRYLREKIDRPFARNSLQTVRGIGYRLTASESMSAHDRESATAVAGRPRLRSHQRGGTGRPRRLRLPARAGHASRPDRAVVANPDRGAEHAVDRAAGPRRTRADRGDLRAGSLVWR